MNTLIYFFGRGVVAFLQMLPLVWVARMGRAAGALAFWIDKRHRRVALDNLTLCFGHEKSPEEIYARVFRELKPRTAAPEMRVEFCRFANADSFIRLDGGVLLVRISDLLAGAPAPKSRRGTSA